jgi:hypothetical protein
MSALSQTPVDELKTLETERETDRTPGPFGECENQDVSTENHRTDADSLIALGLKFLLSDAAVVTLLGLTAYALACWVCQSIRPYHP